MGRQYDRRYEARWLIRFVRVAFVCGVLTSIWYVTHAIRVQQPRADALAVGLDGAVFREKRNGFRKEPRMRPRAALMDAASTREKTPVLFQLAVGAGTCARSVASEFTGDVVKWGSNHITSTAAECCAACSSTERCNVWVWCGEHSCGSEKFGACWLKRQQKPALAYEMPILPRVPWISGAIYTAEEALEANRLFKARYDEREARRETPGNHVVYLDVSIDDAAAKRIEFVLYSTISPLAAENFRRMCVGEPEAEYTWVGATFYRILDKFIDQTGVSSLQSAVHPGAAFDDDKGGLQLKHDRVGLLSLANAGPNTNTGHFSIVMAPAPHLDGKYVVFGEVLSGIDHAWDINALASASGSPTRVAKITGAGVLQTL